MYLLILIRQGAYITKTVSLKRFKKNTLIYYRNSFFISLEREREKTEREEISEE